MMTTAARDFGREHDVELEILTVPEVARLLRVPKSTIYKLSGRDSSRTENRETLAIHA